MEDSFLGKIIYSQVLTIECGISSIIITTKSEFQILGVRMTNIKLDSLDFGCTILNETYSSFEWDRIGVENKCPKTFNIIRVIDILNNIRFVSISVTSSIVIISSTLPKSKYSISNLI